MQKRLHRLAAVAALAFLALAPASSRATDQKDRVEFLIAPGYQLVPGDYAAGIPDTLVYLSNPSLNLYRSFTSRNSDGTINAVVEIPEGDIRKFETNVTTGQLFWELKNGAPRKVAYVGYPTSYGMVPRTLGGDGDPLDVVVIGPMQLRGTVAAVTLAGLDAAGVLAILRTWFESYKGPGEIQVTGFEDVAAAQQTLAEAEANFA